MGLTSGTKLGPYEIQSPLGAGGMGEVYRATDTKLGRDVALKVLPAEMAQDPERLGRFRREAKTLAQLDHPNIVTIYSVEECDGVHFLTMQLVEGLALDGLIPGGGLALAQIIEIASALGDALAAAHEKGIVHRDLKPANVMVSNDGRVKVLDFGLAKDIRATNLSDATMTSDSRTQIGVVMGTPAYMSPEQTSGRPLDHRTDIFSLGVLLHEMATGRRPFEGTSSAELVSAILRDTPPSVTDSRPDLPSDLARIVRRCLEKDPRHRVQTARDVSNEFRDLARQSSQKVVPSKTSFARDVAAADSGGVRAALREDEGFWVAVLPFKCSGSNAELAALAEGITDEVITGLSRFSYLRIIGRSYSSRYSGQSVDVRTAGKELNARYVMEGALRHAGSRLRLAVQLVDTVSGTHLWAENYERAFSAETIFELQDDLVPRIVSTVADMNGILPRSMSEGLRGRPAKQLSPYESVLRSFAYTYSATPEELVAARSGLEEAVRKAPAYADAWAMLSFLCAQDYVHGYELQAEALEIATSAARRAVALGPSNHLAYFSLGQALWCQKDFDLFRDAAERAVLLNPMDGNSVAYLGELLIYAASTERGMQLVERAKQLNPNHPGWYWFADFYHAFSQGDYRGAHNFALKAKLRGNPLAPMFLAAACGQLGDIDGGAKAVSDLLKFRPELPAAMRKQVAKVWNPEYGERFLEGLQKAGMEIPTAGPTAAPSTTARAHTASGQNREDEGFWVAVLPFKYSGNNADLVALAEGLTDDIVTNMSKFSYLRMIARSSTAQYAQRSVDVRMAAKELGARYVMEGSIRQAGAKVRIAVQLVDANTGAGLWAEAYDRPFSSEATLDILDEVVPRIVATVGDAQGVLAHSMTESLRNRDPESLTPYEALLRSFGFHLHVSASEHLAGITALERAVKQAPDRADCWAMLSWLYRAEYTHEYNARPDPMERSLAAAQRAVNLAPSSQLAHAALASAFFFRRELGAFRSAAERALSLNQMQGYTTAFMGLHFAYSGDWERGCALCEHSTQLNPSHPGWYWLPPAIDAYRQHAGDRALEYALKINMPGLWTAQVALAIIHAQLGHQEQARTAVRDLLALRPDFATVARRELQKWWLPDMVEQMLTDLHKAGLGKTETTAAPGLSSGISVGRTASGSTRADEGFWVAVLPFKCTSTNADLKALAEGLSEEVVTGLSRFSYLRVIVRGSTAKYSSESGDVGAIGKELRTRYVMEGSMRQAGAKLRLAVQLVDAISGAHLWAETYERAFTPESVFEVQDDLVPRIVSTVADQHGVLPRRIGEELRVKNEEDLTPHEAVLCAFSFLQRISPTEHATARRILERAVERDPNQADAWAMLAIMYDTEFADEYNPRPHPLERATAAAQRAVDLAPTHALGYYALAFTHFFRKDHAGFRGAVEQAMALNPMDGSVMGLLGLLVHHSGEIKRGTQMVEAAMQLNPHYPPVFRAPAFLNAYAQGKYGEALELAVRFNMPGFFHAHALRAAALGQLGQREAGQQAVQELLAARPDFATTARRDYGKWWDAKTVDHLVEGLRKAGLPIADGDSKPAPLSATASPTSSGESRADEGFWVAVLPFKFTGNNADLKSLAEGLSEEVITGLSRFSYLRVIARGSTAKYSSESGDIRAIGKELGARYVMEASQRQAGSKLRLAVQLVDAVSGAHLWAETYERTFSAETVFELQDDLVPRIVSTVADQYGVLPRSMSEVLRSKKDEDLTPQEAVLRAFSYFTRITADEHAVVRRILERAVHEAPDHADSWAMLSMIYRGEFAQGYNAGPNPLDRALAAAQRAVDLAPTHALGHYSLATVHFFRKEMIPFRVEAERAFALNPLDASVKAYLGLLTAASGEWDRGCKIVESAMQLNPNCPGYFYFAGCCNAYRLGKYEEVLEGAARVNMPSYFHVHALRAAALGQLDRREEAQKAVYALLALRPDFAAVARQEYAKWYSPDLIEQIVDGLRKAGLEIPDDARQISSGALTATPSVAVLPFANMSDDKEQDYFSDGLAEEIINLLAQIQGLKVIARTSAFAFRGKEQDIRGIAETLGVSTVLEGSVRRSGSRIRVTAQLINATDGSHLWSERYDRELSDIFAVQDEIAAAIANALRVKLSREAIPQRYTPKLPAYEAYLKARYQQAKVTPDSMELARRFYEQAGELDPGFAMAHVGLGFYWYNLSHFGRHFAVDCIAPARAEAQRALQIDPSLPEAHALLGYLAAMHDLDWAAAEKYFDFPVAKQVGFGLLRPLYAWVLFWQGNVEPAIKLAQRAIEEDPLEVWARMNLHAYLQGAGRENEALVQLKKVLELDENQVVALVSMAMILADNGNISEALKIARRAYAIGPWSPDTIGVLAGLTRRNSSEVESSLMEALGSGEAPGDARAHALFHLLCGELDEGADWVEKAVAQRDSSMMVYLRYVVSKSLRASHRWPTIAKMINLPVQPSTLLAQ